MRKRSQSVDSAPRQNGRSPAACSPSLYRELHNVAYRMIFLELNELERERCMTMRYGQLRRMILRRYRQVLKKRLFWSQQRHYTQQITLITQQLKELKTLIENHDH